jgi:alpha-1,6-mannosyltransferase
MLALLGLAALFYQTPAVASNRIASEVFSWLFVGGMLVAFVRGYDALKAGANAAGEVRAIVGFATAFGLIALIIPPFHSTDTSCYINRGWQQVGYGLNPYLHPLHDTPNWRLDPMFRPEWIDAPSPYGFLFEGLACTICRLGNGNWIATLLLFKAACLVVFAITGWVVWKGCRSMQLPHPERALYLLLWNPLMIAHSLINGHNDLWMGMLAAVGVCLTVTGCWLWALPALMAATLIKYASAALFPFTLLYLGKRFGWWKAGASVGVALLVFALSAWPYLPENWRQLLVAQGGVNSSVQNSLAAMVLLVFEQVARWFPSLEPHWSLAASTIKITFWVGFFAFYATLAWVRVRGGRYDRSAYLRDCVLIQFVLICLTSSKYYAWYLGMFFPLVLYLPEGDRLRRVVLAVACAHLLSFTFVAQSHFLNAALMLVIPLIWALRSGSPASSPTALASHLAGTPREVDNEDARDIAGSSLA